MNYVVKQVVLGSIIGMMGFGFSGCGGTSVAPAHQKQVGEHAKMYTQVGMHAQGSGLSTLNFTLGAPIPVNSVIFYEDINSKQVAFTYNDKRYYLRNSPKHSKTNMDQMLDRYFAAKEVNLSKFTAKEQAAIKEGRVEVGMRKEAVVLAQGYPPVHATPTLEQNSWTYWKFQRGYVSDKIIYHFTDNKVSSIED